MKDHIQFDNTPAQFNMIAIEGNIKGELFNMGGESWLENAKPIHPVRLSDFWLCEFHVTQAVWESVVGSNPAYFKGANRPVEQVSYVDIVEKFLPKLNKNTEGVRPEGTQYHLPTEAQWEYAARGGQYWEKYNFAFSGSDKLNEVGWNRGNSYNETKPVCLKKTNVLGLNDMSGNVWVWCKDWYSSDFYKVCQQQGVVENPCNCSESTLRVLRGGSCFDDEQFCHTTFRNHDIPTISSYAIGFRLALIFPSV
jgi:formylglycine-generating enzyme